MTKATSPIPFGQHAVTPHLVIKDAANAIEFYKKAFGAEEICRYTMADGRIIQADIKIGDAHIFLSDEFPEHIGSCLSPQTLKGTNATMHLFVPDVDKAFARAVDAGATPEMTPETMFWGNRYGRVVDPFMQPWSLATHLEDLTPEEVLERGAKFFAQTVLTK